MFDLQPAASRLATAALELTPIELNTGTAKCDLALASGRGTRD